MARKLSVIIPVYNEKETVLTLIRRVEEVDLGAIEKEILIVDDGSTDGTHQLLLQFEGKHILLFNRRNEGKGAAIRKALEHVSGDMVIIQDADLEYDPNDYPKLIEPILRNESRVVYGSRVRNRENKRHSGLQFYIGGRFLSMLTNLLYGSDITDEPTCYKVFESKLIKSLELTCKGFEFCPEVTSKILKQGIPITEVPISYHPRKLDEGKKIRWKDGLQAIWVLLKNRF